MLWAFTNFDQLDRKIWKKFEPFLFEMCTLMKKNDLRIIMTRNIDKKAQKLRFRNFYDDESRSADSAKNSTPRSGSKEKSGSQLRV